MAKEDIRTYIAMIRLDKDDNRRNIHVNACSKVGAIYQATLFLKKHNIKEVYAITINHHSYAVDKRKRQTELKTANKKKKHNRDNLKAIKEIKTFLDN